MTVSSFLHILSLKENRRRFLNIRGIASGRYAYKGPDVAQIDLTDRCDSSCQVCWTHSPLVKDRSLAAQELDFEAVKVFIKELADSGAREIIFSGGGEPFLYPRVWEIFEYAQQCGLNFRVNTNFTLLDSAGIKKLLSFNALVSLTISVWAGEPELYCRMHNRTPQIFRQLQDNLKMLNASRSLRLEVKLYALINNLNYRNLEGIVEFASQTGCPLVEFGVMDAVPLLTEKYLLNQEQLDYVRQDFLRVANKRNRAGIVNGDIFLRRIGSPAATKGEYDTSVGGMPCYAGWLFLRLRANGDFNSCLKSHRKPLGNVYKEGFSAVWNGLVQQCFRQKGLSLPRDWDYFRCMSNSNDDRGCRRICDNTIVNARLHRFMRYLPRFKSSHKGQESMVP